MPSRLERKKQELKDELRKLDFQYRSGQLSKEEYVDEQYDVLDGRFREDVFTEIDKKIEDAKNTRNMALTMIFVFGITGAALFFANVNITGFTTLDSQDLATLNVGKNFTGNSTADYGFVNTTSLRASGKIYGHGETWIYLVDGGTRRLVHYADTRQEGNPEVTGMITAENNATQNETVNQTSNYTTNVSNETNANATGNVSTNYTNQAAGGNATAANQTTTSENTTETNTAGNKTSSQEPFKPEIRTNKGTYALGENVTVTVLPDGSVYTLYLHAPSDTYIVTEDSFQPGETGNHRLSGLVSKDNQTERATKEFYVTTPVPTATFTGQCVETCSMPETPVSLEIVTKGTMLELGNVSYVPDSATEETTENTTNQTQTQQETQPEQPAARQKRELPKERQCLRRNPNARPKSCFGQQEWNSRFPRRNFTLVNSEGNSMATIGHTGNMYIDGNLIENAQGGSLEYDYVVKDRSGNELAWIDAITGDLHVRGQVTENTGTFEIDSRSDYPIVNPEGMYLAMFDDNGDLLLRGELVEGGGSS